MHSQTLICSPMRVGGRKQPGPNPDVWESGEQLGPIQLHGGGRVARQHDLSWDTWVWAEPPSPSPDVWEVGLSLIPLHSTGPGRAGSDYAEHLPLLLPNFPTYGDPHGLNAMAP